MCGKPFVFLILMSVSSLSLAADDEKSVGDRVSTIDQDYTKTYRTDPSSSTALRKARAERTEAYEALIKEIEGIDSKTFGYQDHSALGRVYASLRQYDKSIDHCRQAIALSPNDYSSNRTLVTSLVSSNKANEAEEAFQKSLKQLPGHLGLLSLHSSLAYAHHRAENFQLAAIHRAGYLDFRRASLSRPETVTRDFGRYVDLMTSAFLKTDEPKQAIAEINKQIDALQKDALTSPKLEVVFEEVRAKKIVLLSDLGEAVQAESLLQNQMAEGRKNLSENPDKEAAIMRVAFLMNANATILEKTEVSKFDQIRTEYLEFLKTHSEKYPKFPSVVGALVSARLRVVSNLIRVLKVDEAELEIRTARENFKSLSSTNEESRARLASGDRSLRSYLSRLKTARLHAGLIQKPSFDIDVDAWVNNRAFTNGDLKGKVVLLDFWAVWCGPCIATFPHLREWHSKFERDGLVIVGLTNYYGYGWDERLKRPTRVDDLSPEDERAAMVKFAKHHKLKHSFAVMSSDAELSTQYGVRGIPQVVLIDRSGRVRMIRVGSTPANGRELETLIETLIAEPGS